MVNNKFATSWKSSVQPRKQRKYTYNLPLHLKQKQMHVHLSADLRKKYGYRNILVRKGDKVKILKGQFAKKEGKVDTVTLNKGKVYVVGVEIIKKDGTKLPCPLLPSNLMITELDLSDRKRKDKLELKSKGAEKKVDAKEVKKTVEKKAPVKEEVKPSTNDDQNNEDKK
jgi:large subunit ribosomal protein L24